MAMSVKPAIEGTLSPASGHYDPAAMSRSRSTVPIMARGLVVPHLKAAHMTAPARTAKRVKNSLPAGGHPHMTAREFAAFTAVIASAAKQSTSPRRDNEAPYSGV